MPAGKEATSKFVSAQVFIYRKSEGNFWIIQFMKEVCLSLTEKLERRNSKLITKAHHNLQAISSFSKLQRTTTYATELKLLPHSFH